MAMKERKDQRKRENMRERNGGSEKLREREKR